MGVEGQQLLSMILDTTLWELLPFSCQPPNVTRCGGGSDFQLQKVKG